MKTTKEAADAAGLKLDQVYGLVRNGDIAEPSSRFGKAWAWTSKEVQSLVDLVSAHDSGGESGTGTA